MVLPGVTIESGTAIGSMCLINKKTEPWSIYTGIPATKKGDRKKDVLCFEKALMEKRRNE